jgi:hypothetical protein
MDPIKEEGYLYNRFVLRLIKKFNSRRLRAPPSSRSSLFPERKTRDVSGESLGGPCRLVSENHNQCVLGEVNLHHRTPPLYGSSHSPQRLKTVYWESCFNPILGKSCKPFVKGRLSFTVYLDQIPPGRVR